MKPYYIILDTETNGFLSKHGTAVSQYSGRILQIAWSVHTAGGKLLKKESYYITPVNYNVGATEIHGITNETINSQSVDFDIAIKLFVKDLKTVKAVVGHHIYFDESVLVNELNMRGKTKMIDHFNDVAWICSQKLASQLYGRGLLNLKDIYQKIFNQPMKDAHNAIGDVEALGQIVAYWISNKIIKKSFTPYPSVNSKGIESYLTLKKKSSTVDVNHTSTSPPIS